MKKSQRRFYHTLTAQKVAKRTISTSYKDLHLKKVPHPKNISVCAKKEIQVLRSPWNQDTISSQQVQILMERLSDTPQSLYKAVNRKTQRKFKILKNMAQKQNYEEKMIKRIQAKQREYQEEYRKLLLSRKNYELKTDLPYIKYIRQDDKTQMINNMHQSTKLML